MNQAGRVPAFDLTRQIANLKPELMSAFERVLGSGHFILGSEVEALEREMAAYLGAKHASGVASGTDALWLALKALGIGPGDKVLTVPFTFFATASAILNTGADPVFIDIEEDTFNLDFEDVKRFLEGQSMVHGRLKVRPERIKAILAVHLYGQAVDMAPLRDLAQERGILLIEDAAQAIGAEYHGKRVGTLGSVGCFSFFPTKNLGGFGDGGLVATNDDGFAEKIRLLRAHGSRQKYYHQIIGTNSRLDALQAAVLRVKLKRLDEWIVARQAIAARYDESFQTGEVVRPPARGANRNHTYHQYTIRVPAGRRDQLRNFLQQQAIETAIYYPVPVHLQSALSHLGYREGDFPKSEQACREVLSLPIFPELKMEEQKRVVDSLKRAMTKHSI